MNNHAGRRKDRQGCRIGNTVVNLNKFYPEASQIDGLSVLDHLSLGALHQFVFF